jgi:hypothetical protein
VLRKGSQAGTLTYPRLIDTPGNLIAPGRDSDIFEFGHGRVLRRSPNGRPMALEAKTMESVGSHGFAGPEVFAISDDGIDLVMERIDGPTIDIASSRPWKIRGYARDLAELHKALHSLPAPPWLPEAPFGSGERLLHMDFHPLNVLSSKNGPIVIGWPNIARGEPAIDAAATWLPLFSGELATGRAKAAVLSIGCMIILNSFLASFSKTDLLNVQRNVVEWKRKDPNMSDAENLRMRSLLTNEKITFAKTVVQTPVRFEYRRLRNRQEYDNEHAVTAENAPAGTPAQPSMQIRHE